jgi:hypothetical protein
MVSKLRKVTVVSFPRSGHHLLIDCLCKYFSRDLSLSTSEKNPIVLADDFGYCEFYGHCRKIPCTNPRVICQKNHDFDLSLKNNALKYYIIQFRNPVDSIISWFEYELKRERKTIRNRAKINIKDTYDSWLSFSKEKAVFWDKFFRKWVLDNKNKKVLFIQYEDLIANPYYAIKEAVNFISPHQKADLGFIKKIVNVKKIGNYRVARKFKHYSKESVEIIKDATMASYKHRFWRI